MLKLSVCLLTFNSERLLHKVIPPLIRVADEIIVIDSGSTDSTLNICQEYGLSPIYNSYRMHGEQMNVAISHASHDWVLCMDSDEILDEQTCQFILTLKAGEAPPANQGWRITRYWYVLGEEIRTIYPISSPDYPIRLFHRHHAQFNLRPVDDQVEGNIQTFKIEGHVRHDTFWNLHEVFNKLNSYTTRLVKYKRVRPSLLRGVISGVGAFFKWYLFSGAWRKGKVGAVTGLYATLYSFLKYFKAWYVYDKQQGVAAKERTDSRQS